MRNGRGVSLVELWGARHVQFAEDPLREQLLEPILRQMRIGGVLPILRDYRDCELLDVGCGWDARLLRSCEPFIKRGIGIDFKAPAIKSDRISTIATRLDEKLPFPDQRFDVVTMLAVLEHLDNPMAILAEISRVLRPGGRLLLTVPSWYAKPVLEFLAFRIGIVNADEIRDHKRYYSRAELFSLFVDIRGLTIESHVYFQGVFNNRLVARKDA
jgi:SAM-dependent methyltransferase